MKAESNGRPPTVSVVMPTHNRARLLRRSVASVLAQTHAELELIVVDDGSRDDTQEVLASFTDPRLVVLRNEVGGGAAAARNKGLAVARAPWVAFQDDDDTWLVRKLERQLAALQARPDVHWCLGSFLSLSPQGVRFYGGAYYREQIDYRLGIGAGGPDWYLITTPNWVVRTELLRRLGGFDERIRSWDDWELSLRIRQETDFVHVDEVLWVQDRVLGGGLTRAERARADDMRIILAKHGHLWSAQPKVLARHQYLVGRAESLYDGRAGAGRDMLLQALHTWPWRWQTWLALAASLLPSTWIQKFTRSWRDLRARVGAA